MRATSFVGVSLTPSPCRGVSHTLPVAGSPLALPVSCLALSRSLCPHASPCRGVSPRPLPVACLSHPPRVAVSSRPPRVAGVSRPLPVTVSLSPSPGLCVPHALSCRVSLSTLPCRGVSRSPGRGSLPPPLRVTVSSRPPPWPGLSLPGSRGLTPSPCRAVLAPGWHPEPPREPPAPAPPAVTT